MARTQTVIAQARKKIVQKINIKTILFSLMWIASLGIMFVAAIMIETQFSFAEDPNRRVAITIRHTEDLPIIYNFDDIYSLLENKLPRNISESSLNEIKIGTHVFNEGDIFIIEDTKSYEFKASFYIKYDMSSMMIRTALNTAGIILITFGVIFHVISKRKLESEQYQNAIQTISDISALHRPVVWQDYQDQSNWTRKVRQWKANLSTEENKLDDSMTKNRWWTSEKRREEKENSLRIWARGTLEEKLEDPYAYKKLVLREQQTDEWINNNLEYKGIKYDSISHRLIFVGKDIKNHQENPNETITKNRGLRMFLENLPRLLIGMGVSFLISAIVFDLTNVSGQVLATIFLSIINVVWNTFLAANYGGVFFETYDLADAEFRKSAAVEYRDYLMIEEPEPEVIKISKLVKEEEPNEEKTSSEGEASEESSEQRGREEENTMHQRFTVERT